MAVFKNIVLPTLTVVTPVLVALTTIWTDSRIGQVDERVRLQGLEIAQNEDARAERESLQQYNLDVLREVKAALEHRDEVLQQVVIGLLSSMPNRQLAETWLEAIRNSEQSSPGIKEQADNARQVVKFEREQEEISHRSASAAFDWEDYDYDIFWCEESGEPAREIAEKIVEALRQEKAKGRLRVRPLPAAVNARPGYRVKGFQVRRNADELDQGAALKRLGDAVLPAAGDAFEIRSSKSSTPYYVSAFICP